MADFVLNEDSQARGPVGVGLEYLCKTMAVAAGLVLTAMAFMSIISIAGRTFFSQPILGDYELVQMFSAIAVSLSLPYTHWVKGHVIVDFFTTSASPRLIAWLDAFANLIMAAIAGLVTWRMWLGLFELRESMDASMLLEMPVWWTYVPMVAAFALLCASALYAIGNDFGKMRS
ncbi:TRAP transporter small permease [uncultured Limnohabitans sp.]|uniref:TRAP transporter small permease n=1 Tax=uncultured Limnohabitans sp. TaxID=768543 RepID=UPI0026048CCC|nr:TRAP transporter small permease [uncultured Limnohabitans sp.]